MMYLELTLSKLFNDSKRVLEYTQNPLTLSFSLINPSIPMFVLAYYKFIKIAFAPLCKIFASQTRKRRVTSEFSGQLHNMRSKYCVCI